MGFLAHWEGLFSNTLLPLYPWFQYGWSSYATYTGIVVMLAVFIRDLVSSANRCGNAGGCTFPARHA